MRIAIADDEALFRKGIIRLLGDFGATLAFEAANGEELLKLLANAEDLPDLLLLDLNMPKINGVEVAKSIKIKYPYLKFVVLSSYFSKIYIISMIELGAAGYLSKNSSPQEMETTILQVIQNGFYYSREVMEIIRENMVNKTKPNFKTPFGISLSDREKEILQLICEEYTTSEIAERLFLSKRTVDGHRNNLLQKMDCRNTAGLVISAIQENLIEISRLKLGKSNL